MIVDKKVSQIDKVTKYLYKSERYKPFLLEYTYVDNNSGKDIICMPSFSSCTLGCEFCHLTQRENKRSVPVLLEDNLNAVSHILQHQELGKNKTLLLSFMGAGEPTLNIDTFIETAKEIRKRYLPLYEKIRFAVATMLPNLGLFYTLVDECVEEGIDLKIHYSLHLWDDATKLRLMPAATPTSKAIKALESASRCFPVEVHYTPFSSNSSVEDTIKLKELLKTTNFNLKILNFSERPDHKITADPSLDFYNKCLQAGIPENRIEFYCPPGKDVQGCCGEFEMDFSKYWD